MLNLFDPVIYTADEQSYVDGILKPLKGKAWDDTTIKTKKLKNHISTHTIIAQGGRCAYCESPLLKGSLAIEHIAHKGKYGEFCFEPYNLVTACTSCNSPGNKGENDTIKGLVNRRYYADNRFIIVHPYFDNPNDHFKYIDSDKTMYDTIHCSAEAQETIKMMHWDETWAYNQRVRNVRAKDIPTNVLDLVGEISTYRK